MTMEVYCKHQKPHQDALSSTTPVENRRTVGFLMGFLEVLAGVTKIEVDPYHPLGSLEPSETLSGYSCPQQLQLGSRRTGGVLMWFFEVLAGVTKIKVDPYHSLGSLEPSETPSGCSCPPQLQLGSRRTGGVLMGPQDSFFKSNFLTRVCVGNNSFYFQVDGNLCSSGNCFSSLT